ENSWLTALFALGIVVVLIVLGVWLLKLLFNATSNVSRGRNRRLSVVDSVAIDQKRQLLIVRRDNVEHLILVGGPQDVVIEAGIAVEEAPAAQSTRRPVPMVARRPAPQAKVVAPAPVPAPAQVPAPAPAPAAVPAPAVTNEVHYGPTILDKLREAGHPTDKRARVSLRHTGLLRPVNEVEPTLSPENSGFAAPNRADSAKEVSAQRDIEGTNLAKGNNEANRN
ncbi:MAG TPA: flagellar biosynthetic protein FliO, partial [Devosia sp.]|nr:flagellar biosynthetic protein FliO [Devosia sp.]